MFLIRLSYSKYVYNYHQPPQQRSSYIRPFCLTARRYIYTGLLIYMPLPDVTFVLHALLAATSHTALDLSLHGDWPIMNRQVHRMFPKHNCEDIKDSVQITRDAVLFGMGARGRRAPSPLSSATVCCAGRSANQTN